MVKVVAAVAVTVVAVDSVVSTNAVPVVVKSVVPAIDVATSVPLEVTVVLITVTAVTTAVVSTGTVVTVCVTITVSNVVKGSVMVSVTVLSGPVAVALPKGTSLLRGWIVADVTDGRLVGKGCEGGCPAVSSELMMDYCCQNLCHIWIEYNSLLSAWRSDCRKWWMLFVKQASW